MPRPISVQVIHRNRLFRECITSVLSREYGFRAQGLDERQRECLGCVDDEPANVVLVDLDLPYQLAPELIREARRSHPDCKVLALIPANAHEKIVECVAAEPHGCVLDESSLEELREAIEKVAAGQTFCSPEILEPMFAQVAKLARESQWREKAQTAELTPREREILKLLSQRLSNKQIARRLSVSLYTIKNHVHHILEKLGVNSREEAAEYARQEQFVPRNSR